MIQEPNKWQILSTLIMQKILKNELTQRLKKKN